MNDVMKQIKTLSATLDEETTHFHPTGRLLLLGSYESVFLKAVKRKADLLGIDCDLTQYPCPPYKAVVVDRETVPSDIKLTAEVDILTTPTHRECHRCLRRLWRSYWHWTWFMLRTLPL